MEIINFLHNIYKYSLTFVRHEGDVGQRCRQQSQARRSEPAEFKGSRGSSALLFAHMKRRYPSLGSFRWTEKSKLEYQKVLDHLKLPGKE